MKKKHNTTNKDTTNSNDNLDNYLEELDLTLANLEKIGAIFLSLGYYTISIGANLDALEILKINNTGESPEKTFFYGQSLTVIGYILLWIVSINRINVNILKNQYTDAHINLSPYRKLSSAYSLSVFANLIRLDAFAELYYASLNENSTPDNS